MQIDHDPKEPETDRAISPWPALWPLLALLWGWYLYFIAFDWYSLALGFGTGIVVTASVIDRSMRRNPRYWRVRPRDD